MKRHSRTGFTLFQLLILLAVLAILLGLLLPAVQKVRAAAARAQSANNLKQIALAVHNYHAANNLMPAGLDANKFSAAAYLLPFIEQVNVFQLIDFKKTIDDKANAQARAVVMKTFLSPMDNITSVSMDFGATNYLFCAGSKPDLAKNDGIFFKESGIRFADVTDGTSNTVMAGETLKGNSMVKATDVRRQHVQLKKEALKKITDETGVEDFKDDKHIAADRCASWMDGRFLQGTFTSTRMINDERPDVNCGGEGGLSGLRSLGRITNIAMCDGSVRAITKDVKIEVWKALATRNGGEVIDPKDF
jgi:prepilin-type processing-associated H-X9-DG protein